MDALLDDPVFFAPFERFLTPGGWVGRRRLAPTAIWANPSSPSASTQTEKLGLKGRAGGATPDGPRNGPSATGRPRRSMAATQKRPLTRAFTAERVTRIELAWPAWKESARLREPTRMRLLV